MFQQQPIPNCEVVALFARGLNIRLLTRCIFVVLTLAIQFSAESSYAQTVPNRDQWSERFKFPRCEVVLQRNRTIHD